MFVLKLSGVQNTLNPRFTKNPMFRVGFQIKPWVLVIFSIVH